MRALAAIALTLAAIAIAPRAGAWCRTTTRTDFVPTPEHPCDDVGVPLFWRGACAGYSLQRGASANASLEAATIAAHGAFAAWASAGCRADAATCAGPVVGHPSVLGVDLGPVDCDQVEYASDARNANVILFHDHDWPHPDAETEIALTTVQFDKDTGEIFGADIEVNGAHVSTSDDPAKVVYDLQSILTHESGHFFGLAHTQPSHHEAVMFASYTRGLVARTLAEDDACAICAAYPPDRARDALCDPTPRHGFASACAGEPGNPDGGLDDVNPSVDVQGGCTLSPIAPRARTTSLSLAWLAPLAWVIARLRRAQRTQPPYAGM